MKDASFLLLNNTSLLSLMMNVIVVLLMMSSIFTSTTTTTTTTTTPNAALTTNRNVTRIQLISTGTSLYPYGYFCLGKFFIIKIINQRGWTLNLVDVKIKV